MRHTATSGKRLTFATNETMPVGRKAPVVTNASFRVEPLTTNLTRMDVAINNYFPQSRRHVCMGTEVILEEAQAIKLAFAISHPLYDLMKRLSEADFCHVPEMMRAVSDAKSIMCMLYDLPKVE